MKKTKKSSEEPRDRLSELPNSIIFEIFWLLPMRDVVRTTILSKRWENLWTTTPYLNFDRFYDSIDRFHEPEFVNRVLILWKGFKILKFKFGPDSVLIESEFSDIDVWVRLCRENGIQEFYLEDIYKYVNGAGAPESYCVPHSLCSCSSLKVLSLRGCNFEIHGNVQWNQLKSLTIEGPFLDQNLIDKVISGSPQLEVFILNLWDLDENLSIQSSVLKKLSIERPFGGDDYYEPSTVTELRIWSPNLETLDIIGVPYGKCSLMNVSSLTHLTLDFFQEWFGEVNYLGEILGQIFPTIQHVEELTLTYWWIKGLGAMKEKYLLSPLLNFKFLTINGSDVEYKEIVHLLHIFPKLETLVFGSIYNPGFENHDTSFLQVERNFAESFLLHLRTVKITLTKVDDLIFPFIEILLKHASNLQKMVIRVSGIKPPSMPWFLSQKLLRMPRSSSTAELIFDEY